MRAHRAGGASRIQITMVSPVPHHLRSVEETDAIPLHLRGHICDLTVKPVRVRPCAHPAKFAPGLPTALAEMVGTDDLADPMAGSGRLAEEVRSDCYLNEIDPKYWDVLSCFPNVSHMDAAKLPKSWGARVIVTSPPYYPRTDRRKLASHDDAKRGRVVGFRSGYDGGHLHGFVGDPAGCNGILIYRQAMRAIYENFALMVKPQLLVLVVKNQTRLGVELRLDLDTILIAQEAGWDCIERHGWKPPPSLWARWNLRRGTGVAVEDILVFAKRVAPEYK